MTNSLGAKKGANAAQSGTEAAALPEEPEEQRRHVDIWVCEGRVCTSKGASELAEAARGELARVAQTGVQGEHCRVLRGGCYGQCDLSPNVVIREHSQGAVPDPEVNRLTRTFEANETVYACVTKDSLSRILEAHLNGEGPIQELTLRAMEELVKPKNDVTARIRALRLKKRREREAASENDGE